MATGNLLNEIKDLEPKEFYNKVVGKNFRHHELGPEQIYSLVESRDDKPVVKWFCLSTHKVDEACTYTYEDIKDYLLEGVWILVD